MMKQILECTKNPDKFLEGLPMPFSYYTKIADLAFKGAGSAIDRSEIFSHYVDFIGIFIKTHKNNRRMYENL